MKILTKKKQRELMNNILDLYNFGSDALKAIGTHQTDKFDATQALIRQKRITEAAMKAADILQGFFGTRLNWKTLLACVCTPRMTTRTKTESRSVPAAMRFAGSTRRCSMRVRREGSRSIPPKTVLILAECFLVGQVRLRKREGKIKY